MVRIAERTEEEMRASAAFERRLSVAPSEEFGNVIATAVAQMVQRLSLQLVIGFTASGKTARLLSKRRLPVPIMGASNSDRTLKKMCLYRGVAPVNIEIFEQGEEMFQRGQELAVENGLAKDGDTIVFVAGIPLETGATNTLRLHRIELGRDR
jgi:pyruvate kinase